MAYELFQLVEPATLDDYMNHAEVKHFLVDLVNFCTLFGGSFSLGVVKIRAVQTAHQVLVDATHLVLQRDLFRVARVKLDTTH